MDAIFCCSSIQPFKPRKIDHEQKFRTFKAWAETAGGTSTNSVVSDTSILSNGSPYVVQVVRQVNYGPIESKRYFAHDGSGAYLEVTEKDMIDANYQKLNSYKNFRCAAHNKFFELNLYEKDPVNTHHWRANIARPATEIDLLPTSARATGSVTTPTNKKDDITKSPVHSTSKLAQTSDSNDTFKKEDGATVDSGKLEKVADCFKASHPEDDGNMDNDDGEDFYNDHRYDDFSRPDDESEKDFTACSADDCGYCGHCTY